jgi:hypothetical protein
MIIKRNNCIVHTVQIYKILELYSDQKIGIIVERGVLHVT